LSKRTNIIQLKHKDIPKLRDKLLKKQKGICPICKKEIISPVLDHQHKRRINGTGQIRAVICRSCNVLLGKVENNCVRYGVQQDELPFILMNMSKFLKKEHLPYIHPSEIQKPPKLKKSSYNKLKKAATDIRKFPEYPKSGKLTKTLSRLFKKYNIHPEFYKR
jgi:RNase P subunit RPR2